MRIQIFYSAIILILLGGCLNAQNTDDQDSEEGISMFATCPESFAEISNLDSCANEIMEVQPEEIMPSTGWVCTERTPGDPSEGHGMYLYWNPQEDRHAFYYWAPEKGLPSSGIIAVETDGRNSYYAWNDGPTEGFQVIPEFPEGGTLHVWWFSTDHETDVSSLHEGHWTVNWTLKEDKPFPVRILETESEYRYFADSSKMTNDPQFPYKWTGPITHSGDSGNITINYIMHSSVMIGYSTTPVASCD